jgi:hypothetical protein
MMRAARSGPVPSLVQAPLALAYFAYPLTSLAAETLGSALPRNWIDMAWPLLAAAALPALASGRCLPGRAAALGAAALCLAGTAVLARFGGSLLAGQPQWVPWLMELKPLVYLGAALCWLAAFGPPRPRHFVRWGALLAGALLLELAVRSLAAGAVVRPHGSGEVNYDACLLALSLCMALAGPRPRPGAALWLLLGIAATLSRTALATGGALAFCFMPAHLGVRLLLALACLGGIWGSFAARGLSLESLDRYWMWYSGLRLLATHPWRALTGFWPGLPLPAPVPPSLSGLWTSQSTAWGLSGVFPFHFHGFWLRLLLTWGALPLAALAAALPALLRRSRRLLRSLALLCLLMGLTMGLFYLSNVAVPLYLALAAALRPDAAPARLRPAPGPADRQALVSS